MVFDKSLEPDYVISVAAALERLSEHSIGRAVASAGAMQRPAPYIVEDFRAVPGRGICGTIDAISVSIGNRAFMRERALTVPDEALQAGSEYESTRNTVVYSEEWLDAGTSGRIGHDAERSPGSCPGYQRCGIGISIISGDNRKTTEALAKRPESEMQCLKQPADEKDYIVGTAAAGPKVMMGRRRHYDAPALTLSRSNGHGPRHQISPIESADASCCETTSVCSVHAQTREEGRRRNPAEYIWPFSITSGDTACHGRIAPSDVAAGAMAASSSSSSAIPCGSIEHIDGPTQPERGVNTALCGHRLSDILSIILGIGVVAFLSGRQERPVTTTLKGRNTACSRMRGRKRMLKRKNELKLTAT